MTTLVLGAGISGVSAARELVDAGKIVTVLEARERTGGRIYTNYSFGQNPVEFGAEFIRGDKTPTWKLAQTMELRTLRWRKTDDSMIRLENDMWMPMSSARAAFPELDIARSWDLPDAPVAEGDESLDGYLRRIGFSDEQLRYVSRFYGNVTAEAPQHISAQAMLEARRNKRRESGTGDFSILEGYTALIKTLAQGLDIRTGIVVETVEWGRDGVKMTAKNGEIFEADNAVITLPLGVLQAEKVRFVPELPDDKQTALKVLSMGPAIKLIYRFDTPVVDDSDIRAIYSEHSPPMWWSPSAGYGADEHVWTGFAGGDWARELLAQGAGGALLQGLKALQMELDKPGLEPVASHLVNWVDDPFALGGYSVAMTGGVGARAQLAKPAPPLYWAGEATAANHQAAMAHGAYVSGKRAAGEILSK